MTKIIRYSTLSMLAAALMIASGCGGPASSSVSGKLSYKGEPVPSVRVNLMAANGKVWFAETDSSGAFSNFNPGGGVLPGDYTVTLVRIEEEATTDENTGIESYAVDNSPLPYPAKYAAINSSDLKVTVTAGENAPLDLKLTD